MKKTPQPPVVFADLVHVSASDRQYQCALAVAYPPECGPPPWCAMTIDPFDPYLELVVQDALVHRYCARCAHVLWRYWPCGVGRPDSCHLCHELMKEFQQ